MFWYFDYCYGIYENQIEKQVNKGVLLCVLDENYLLSDYWIQLRYWVDKSLIKEMLVDDVEMQWFFLW